MNEAYLLLGSNQGESKKWLSQAREMVALTCGDITAVSGVYRTAAWGKNDQPDFLNQVILIQTALLPQTLLTNIQQIEQALGRQRIEKWGQRTLDVDILFYNDDIINTPELTIPHPFLHLRRFTLVPLAELAGSKVHPVLKQSVTALLLACPDKLTVMQEK